MLDLFSKVPNVVVLATDVHATLVGQVDEAARRTKRDRRWKSRSDQRRRGRVKSSGTGTSGHVPNATQLIASDFFRQPKERRRIGDDLREPEHLFVRDRLCHR